MPSERVITHFFLTGSKGGLFCVGKDMPVEIARAQSLALAADLNAQVVERSWALSDTEVDIGLFGIKSNLGDCQDWIIDVEGNRTARYDAERNRA